MKLKCELPLVELRNATVLSGGRRMFPRTSFRILPGEHWAIVGPNGSGKTTLARALWGAVPVVGGDVLYPSAGIDSAASPWPAGFIPERHIRHVTFEDQRELVTRHSDYLQGRYESLEADRAPTAGEFIGLGGGGRRKGSEPGRRLPGLLRRLGLGGLLPRRVSRLSNGELRKLLIARALLDRPRLLILDEPLGGLDQGSRRELRNMLRQVANRGVTLLIVTSRRRDIIDPVRRILCVRGGRVVARGSRRELARSGRLAKLLDGASPAVERRAPPPAVRRRSSGAALVELADVSVQYGAVRVLDRVSWTIRERQSWALLGPNGSGKTTLASLILADHPQAYANDVRLFGRPRADGRTTGEIKALLGHVSPEIQVHHGADTSVHQVICSGFFESVGLYHGTTPDQEREAGRWAQALGLGRLAGRSYTSLSEGERRLVLIARALVKGPRLLVLDEPCQGLDEPHRRKVIRLIDRLARRGSPALVFITHDRGEIPRSVSHVLRLAGGRAARAGRRRR
jgi:molybdate transport system ATP-binding protein